MVKKLTGKFLRDIDKKHVWHPFTQMSEWMEEDFPVISHGKDNYIYDVDGKKYLDGVSSIWCNIHGYANRELNEALRKQMDKISHSTFLGMSN
ncbi:MAG TPA: aminotransferase class III-fold pyridoxal phosphate-dependent enzyme, partial [bacterium]